jgi:hypothetical protein
MLELNARDALEQHSRHVHQAAGPAARELEQRLGLRRRRGEVARRVRLDRRVHQQDERHFGDQRHWRKRPVGVVRKLLVQRRRNRLGDDASHQKHVTVGLGLGYEFSADTRLVLDEHRAPPALDQLGGDQPCADVGFSRPAQTARPG